MEGAAGVDVAGAPDVPALAAAEASGASTGLGGGGGSIRSTSTTRQPSCWTTEIAAGVHELRATITTRGYREAWGERSREWANTLRA